MTMVPDIDRLVAPRSVWPIFSGWRGPSIIGFCGAAGAGKSTAADYFRAAHGFTRVRFAGPLKDMLRALGLTDAEVDGDAKERPSPILGGKTPRQAMQWLGTEWGRVLVDPDLWLNAWAARADVCLANGGSVAVDDVRFANEAAAIRARGGIVVRIVAPTIAIIAPQHISETIGFQWDAEVINPSGDRSAFQARLAGLFAPPPQPPAPGPAGSLAGS